MGLVLIFAVKVSVLCISHVSFNVVAEASAEAAHIISALSEVPSVPAPGTSDVTAPEPPVPAPPAGQHWITHTAYNT